MKIRLDNLLVDRKMVESRSQAESYIKLGKVTVDGIKRTKPGFFVDVNSELKNPSASSNTYREQD